MKKTLDDWLKWQETLHSSEIDLGLDRIYQVAKNLKLLSTAFPIITVAGTNGKGSCVALLESILSAEGYKTGSYTSPHLISYNERIKINTFNADDELIIAAFEEIDQARKNISLSYFEFGTLAAMLIFFKQNVDVAILEVGLGGRLDAANLWDTSLALITSIAIDHESWLGNDRESIAKEKSGIMRENTPVICGDKNPPKSIKSEAERVNAVLYQIDNEFFIRPSNKDNSWQLNVTDSYFDLPYPALKGEFQINNAATVITGLRTIQKQLPVSLDSYIKGLKKVSIIGRLQLINKSPDWLIDVAHNPHSAKALSNYLKSYETKGKTYALFSILKDKDLEEVLKIMDQHIDEWHIVGLESNRGFTTEQLKDHMQASNISSKIVPHEDFSTAIKSLKKGIKNKDKVVAFGSFLVISELMQVWKS